MSQDIFALRRMVAEAERAADLASSFAVTAGNEATSALHTVRSAIATVDSAVIWVKKVAEKGEDVRAAIVRIRSQQRLHPDLEQAMLGADMAQTSIEETLSNLYHLKSKLKETHEVATRTGFPIGVNAPAQYRGVKQWLARWISRL